MSQRYKDFETEEKSGGAGLDYEIPDTSSILDRLDDRITRREEIAKEHQEQMEKEEEEVKKGKRKPRQKPKGGTICFCGDPSCNIGGFVERQE